MKIFLTIAGIITFFIILCSSKFFDLSNDSKQTDCKLCKQNKTEIREIKNHLGLYYITDDFRADRILICEQKILYLADQIGVEWREEKTQKGFYKK